MDNVNVETTALNDWRAIGTLIGNAGTAEFTFILRKFQAKVGDIVALQMDMPGATYRELSCIYVWARITDIHRFNPFFPFEAAQEIAGEGIELESTVLSGTRDQLEATALILGATTKDNFTELFPLTYPVKPASRIYHPPAEAIRQLLIGGRDGDESALIGTLIAREDVEVTISASKMVSRHLAVLAMTGGGKTVAARRIIRELIKCGYPTLILDPHGDYIGLSRCEKLLRKDAPDCQIKLFYPSLLVQKDGEDLVLKLISQMTTGPTESQADYIQGMFERHPANNGQPALDYINSLYKTAESDLRGERPPTGAPTSGNWRGTVGAVRRALGIIQDRLRRMERTSSQMRSSKKLASSPEFVGEFRLR